MTTTPTRATVPAERRLPGQRRLLTGLMANSVTLYAIYGAVPAVLLANLVADIAPESKSTSLGVISAVGAVGAMLANPISGALSDRTRSRYGRRAPWMAGGALLGGLSLIAAGVGNNLLWVAVAWTLAQIFLNGLQAPLTAVIPDRVPEERRGLFSSAAGLAQMLGAVVGTAVAAAFANALGLGFAVFGVLIIAGTAVFVLLNRESSTVEVRHEPFRWKDFLRGFWISPRAHPDFAWAFLGRFLLILGYYAVSSYQLYVLDDYIGLTRDQANDLMPLLSLAMLPGMIAMIVISGPWSDRVGRRKPFVIAASLGMALSLFLPLVLHSGDLDVRVRDPHRRRVRDVHGRRHRPDDPGAAPARRRSQGHGRPQHRQRPPAGPRARRRRRRHRPARRLPLTVRHRHRPGGPRRGQHPPDPQRPLTPRPDPR